TFEAMTAGFLLVFRKLNDFEYRGEGSLEAWMRQIMVNECLARLRKKRASAFSMVPLEQVAEVSETVFHEIDAGYLYEAIRKLPDGARAVFNMKVLEGYSHKEIAQQLGITDSAARSQLTYAKKKLKEYLEPYFHE
ncbi:MAG: sigma-70 family RNA polymerase sigma factor, partial [Bacteroidota bacterium]